MPNSFNASMRCDETLKGHIQQNLAQFDVCPHSSRQTRKAAVALTVVDSVSEPTDDTTFSITEQGAAALVLTRRSNQLKRHSGQWALPGGQCDPGESPEATALRELKEEVGLALSPDRIMGRLDDFTTRSGFTITPVVVWGGRGVTLCANPAEVRSIHRIPITEFLREDAPILYTIPESEHPVLMMPVGKTSIAAPTAAILYQFREVAIRGLSTRVDHYEQPWFAWS